MKKKTKKRLVAFLITVLCLGLGVAAIMVPHMYIPTISDSISISSHTSRQPLMVAHRGLSSIAPQNSIPAVEKAIEYGYDGCEFDIHTTKDGKWVVIHDDTVDAMTDGEGNVEDYTLKEILELRLDSGHGLENYENLQVPTLEQVLEIIAESDIIPVIEIKKCDVKYLPSLKKMLEKNGLAERAEIISFTREYLEAYRALDVDAEMMLLTSVMSENDIYWCVENGVDTINFHYMGFIKGLKAYRLAKEKGVRLAAWTVDNTVYKDVMVLIGAEVITTNKLIVSS
ncbi:MAG: hypothetical protein E7538_04490 [Ruminococcaceae bacterium]|nr:hypothetical protein [Oscillospiraceae bacterium]